ncbi:hypothetical protein [Actibacterium sp. 188UL27-1]|uniref:hypothetical protein n=1 Tax=Actibacterium sp. 188UL27-1 TaxID=2786961 RepID=UPI00195AFA2D|nr:hypothetical protein [Actibacterium sp. 188UL27-1]MBM7067735.1 hypothetical protein [Actibacterium sp. 188UL27-1]
MLRLKRLTQLLILTLVTATSAAALEDPDAWSLLRLAEIREEGLDEDWRAIKHFPDELRAAADAFEVDGFVVPILPEPYLKQFLLVEQPDNCPFCGNSGYGPVIEVEMKRPLPDLPEFTRVIISGRLELNEDPETFQMFRLVDAVLIDQP